MTDEPEYVSTHDLVSGKDSHLKTKAVPKNTELEDIRKSQKYILDKLSTMDRFLRGDHFRYGHKIMDGEAYEMEVIEKFLTNSRDGKLSEEHLRLCNKILLSAPPKQIKDE